LHAYTGFNGAVYASLDFFLSSRPASPHFLGSILFGFLSPYTYMYIYKGSIPIGGCPPAIQRGYGNLVSDGYGGLHMMADFA
jgi:hypothetical protein